MKQTGKKLKSTDRFVLMHRIREKGRISRHDLTRATGFSRTKIANTADALLFDGLLVEKESTEHDHHPHPAMLALNPDGAYAIGVYLSADQIRVVLLNLMAEIVSDYSLALDRKHYMPENIADNIVTAVKACLNGVNGIKGKIAGLGIALPGLVDYSCGLMQYLPIYQWENVNLKELLEQRLEYEIYVENSTNVLTVSEQWFGHGQAIDNFIVVTLEKAISLGIVINGQLYRGKKGIAGKFGHTIAEPEGPLCNCGLRGCLEAIAGNDAIIREALVAARAKKWRPKDLDDITIDQVIDAARNGHLSLQKIYARAGKVLGMGIANLIHIFSPDKIIISGSGVKAGELIFESMYHALARFHSPKTDSDSPIVVQPVDHKGYARGAGTCVLHEVYKSTIK